MDLRSRSLDVSAAGTFRTTATAMIANHTPGKTLMAEKNSDLNRVSKEELESVPSIGEKRADFIMQLRDAEGGFSSLDHLEEISGFSEKLPEMIHERFTISANETRSGGWRASAVRQPSSPRAFTRFPGAGAAAD